MLLGFTPSRLSVSNPPHLDILTELVSLEVGILDGLLGKKEEGPKTVLDLASDQSWCTTLPPEHHLVGE
jgi:hypothetical protein